MLLHSKNKTFMEEPSDGVPSEQGSFLDCGSTPPAFSSWEGCRWEEAERGALKRRQNKQRMEAVCASAARSWARLATCALYFWKPPWTRQEQSLYHHGILIRPTVHLQLHPTTQHCSYLSMRASSIKHCGQELFCHESRVRATRYNDLVHKLYKSVKIKKGKRAMCYFIFLSFFL